MVDVGIGVGYFRYAASRSEGEDIACRFAGRGNPGEEDNGSKAGSNDGAGRFRPADDGKLGRVFILLGDESIMADIYQMLNCSRQKVFKVRMTACPRRD